MSSNSTLIKTYSPACQKEKNTIFHKVHSPHSGCHSNQTMLLSYFSSVQFSSVLFPSKIQNQTTSKSLKTTNTGWRRCNGRQKPGTCCTPLKEQKQYKTIQDKTRRYKTSAEA